MDVQDLQDNADTRIKFASVNVEGEYVPDAGSEYSSLFVEVEKGWRVSDVRNVAVDRFGRNRAWAITNGRTGLAAVAHETGIEFLIALGAGLAVEALVFVGGWAWEHWGALRHDKIPASLQLERVTERHPDGTVCHVEKLLINGPLSSEAAQQHIKNFYSIDSRLT